MEGFLLTQEANNGDPFAQHQLGLRYLLGKGFPKDTASAVYWISKAASQNITAARFNYGIMLMNGIGIPWNPFEAYGHFKYAAKMGMPEGQFAYAVMLTDNLVVNKNLNEAYIWIKRAADNGFEPAIETLESLKKSGISIVIDTSEVSNESDLFVEGSPTDGGNALVEDEWEFDLINFEEDTVSNQEEIKEVEELLSSSNKELYEILGYAINDSENPNSDTSGFAILNSAAEAGSPEALYLVGKLYEYGIIVDQDSIIALVEYIRSYRIGGFKATRKILEFIQREELFAELKQAVDEKNPDAMYAWAALIALGFDYRLTEAQAFELLKDAAELDHIPSLIEIGLSYYSGRLTVTDKELAIIYWQRAADLGSVEAAVRLAFYNIQESESDSIKSEKIKFLNDMWERGSVLAATVLAYCYENGLGTTVNKARAANLYRSSAQRGNRLAFESLLSMYDKIRPSDEEFSIYEE